MKFIIFINNLAKNTLPCEEDDREDSSYTPLMLLITHSFFRTSLSGIPATGFPFLV